MVGVLTFGSRNCLKFLQIHSTNFLESCIPVSSHLQHFRHRRTKHFDPKFKRLRAQKVVKFDVPNLNENTNDLPKDEMKSRMKEKGILPPRPWIERPFYIGCTSDIFEPYIPPEGDGKISAISAAGAKQKFEFLEKKSKSMLAVRKIRSFDEDFEPPEFAEAAQKIYIDSHTLMCEKNKYKLRELVTEKAYPEMVHNIRDKTIHWKFLGSLELPRVVHARCTDIITKSNIFGQVTVRFHTQQILAIYDRFGRLLHGSEIIAKDVLEYVVFEKHLANEYGVWRLHSKIVPDWAPPRTPGIKTYTLIEPEEAPETEAAPVETAITESDNKSQEIAKI